MQASPGSQCPVDTPGDCALVLSTQCQILDVAKILCQFAAVLDVVFERVIILGDSSLLDRNCSH